MMFALEVKLMYMPSRRGLFIQNETNPEKDIIGGWYFICMECTRQLEWRYILETILCWSEKQPGMLVTVLTADSQHISISQSFRDGDLVNVY